MPSYSTDRRGALKILGAIGASCACPIAGEELFGRTADQPASPEHHHDAGKPAPLPNVPRFFTAADFQTISRIADLIIPGATSSGVPFYIDMVVSQDVKHQSLMSDGLRWLDGEAGHAGKTRFLELTERQQTGILEPLCKSADAGQTDGRLVQFFVHVKGLTADGYYTSETGLIQDLGYKGNAVLSSFPECVHEH